MHIQKVGYDDGLICTIHIKSFSTGQFFQNKSSFEITGSAEVWQKKHIWCHIPAVAMKMCSLKANPATFTAFFHKQVQLQNRWWCCTAFILSNFCSLELLVSATSSRSWTPVTYTSLFGFVKKKIRNALTPHHSIICRWKQKLKPWNSLDR